MKNLHHHFLTVGRLLLWRLVGLVGGRSGRRIRQARADFRLIRDSGLFDRRHYIGRNPDVARRFPDPLWHYELWGGCEGRDPHPLFDTAYFLQKEAGATRP